MIIRTMATVLLVGAFGLAISDSTFAQSTLGGAKTPQNKIGGAAKPAPVIGGATIHTPSPAVSPKPAPIAATTKPSSPGAIGTTTTVTTQTAGNVRPNPLPVAPPNRGAAVANLKCASGACTARGGKP